MNRLSYGVWVKEKVRKRPSLCWLYSQVYFNRPFFLSKQISINIAREGISLKVIHPKRGKIYRKIPKISPGAYIFQRPFLRSLFLEGLLFGRAYLWREISISKSIGLALQLEVNWLFLLYFSLYLRAISKYKPLGGIYSEGRFNGRFLALRVWGTYIWRGFYMEGLIFGILQ